jgi:hypothetical protein
MSRIEAHGYKGVLNLLEDPLPAQRSDVFDPDTTLSDSQTRFPYAIWGIWDRGSDQGQNEFREEFKTVEDAQARFALLSANHSVYNLCPVGWSPRGKL